MEGPFAAHAQRVLREAEIHRPDNTTLAYGPKKEEFRGFCDIVYAGKPHPRTITEEKVFGFLYYQSYRTHFDRKKRGRNGTSLHSRFDKADYDSVMAMNRSQEQMENTTATTPTMEEVEAIAQSDDRKQLIGISLFKQYEAAIMEEHQSQVDHNSNNLSKEQLKSRRVKELKSLVATRRPRIKKANYEEKINNDINPYLMLERLEDMEHAMFNVSHSSKSNGMAALRNRFTMLCSLQQVTRGESLFKCELSDLCDFAYHSRREPDPYHFLVMQIATGKTNKAKTIYGRLIRHKNVNMCGMGALGLYLMLRFHVTKELEEIDFTDNSKWFDIKLLVDRHAGDLESLSRSVSDQYYATSIKSVAKKLGLSPNHFIHFGRNQQPAVLEVEELESTEIKCLGNWGIDVYDDRYSTKMPLKAMRVSAGFEPERGCHFNPRAHVDPPEVLTSQVFPGLAAAEQRLVTYEQTTASAPRSRSGVAKLTAQSFIHLLKNLQRVIIQDAALMIHSGRKHVVFDLPVFKSQEFLDFQRHVIATVAAAEQNNPRDATLEVVIPRVNQKFESLQTLFAAGIATVNSKQDLQTAQLNTMLNMVAPLGGFVQHMTNYQYNPNQFRGATPLSTYANQVSTGLASPPPIAAPTQPPLAAIVAADGYEPARQYDSVSTIYGEWHGITPHSGPEGGIASQEQRFKAQWRSHWDDGAKKRFSRMKFLVASANSLNEDIENVSIQQILQALDQVFVEEKKSLYRMERYIKNNRAALVEKIQTMNLVHV